MVAALALALALFAGPAHAASATIAPSFAVTGKDSVATMRPGLRVGYEPIPATALEVQGDVSPEGEWDAALALAGRGFFGTSGPGEGLFVLGRLAAGLSGFKSEIGPMTGLYAGFGARPVPGLELAVSTGPEWAFADGGRWRTELSVGWVIREGTFRSKPGQGKVRHKPNPIPGK